MITTPAMANDSPNGTPQDGNQLDDAIDRFSPTPQWTQMADDGRSHFVRDTWWNIRLKLTVWTNLSVLINLPIVRKATMWAFVIPVAAELFLYVSRRFPALELDNIRFPYGYLALYLAALFPFIARSLFLSLCPRIVRVSKTGLIPKSLTDVRQFIIQEARDVYLRSPVSRCNHFLGRLLATADARPDAPYALVRGELRRRLTKKRLYKLTESVKFSDEAKTRDAFEVTRHFANQSRVGARLVIGGLIGASASCVAYLLTQGTIAVIHAVYGR